MFPIPKDMWTILRMLPWQLEEQPSGEPGLSEATGDHAAGWVAFAGGGSLHGIQLGADSQDLLESFGTVGFEACVSAGSQGISVSVGSSERDVQLSRERAILEHEAPTWSETRLGDDFI